MEVLEEARKEIQSSKQDKIKEHLFDIMSLQNISSSKIKSKMDVKADTYNTPQELFSSFKIPDFTEDIANNRENLTSKKKQPSSEAATETGLTTRETAKHRQIQPNIILPTNISSPVSKSSFTSSTSNLTLQNSPNNIPNPSKPLLLHGQPANSYYYLNQGCYGYPTSYPNYPPLYGIPNTFPDPRFIVPYNKIQRDKELIMTASKEIETTDSKKNSNDKQLFTSIQGQMAASQIPLCLVQDTNGQLHQLVYTVPKKLYNKYVTAASKGMKIKVQENFKNISKSIKIEENKRDSNKDSVDDVIILDDNDTNKMEIDTCTQKHNIEFENKIVEDSEKIVLDSKNDTVYKNKTIEEKLCIVDKTVDRIDDENGLTTFALADSTTKSPINLLIKEEKHCFDSVEKTASKSEVTCTENRFNEENTDNSSHNQKIHANNKNRSKKLVPDVNNKTTNQSSSEILKNNQPIVTLENNSTATTNQSKGFISKTVGKGVTHIDLTQSSFQSKLPRILSPRKPDSRKRKVQVTEDYKNKDNTFKSKNPFPNMVKTCTNKCTINTNQSKHSNKEKNNNLLETANSVNTSYLGTVTNPSINNSLETNTNNVINTSLDDTMNFNIETDTNQTTSKIINQSIHKTEQKNHLHESCQNTETSIDDIISRRNTNLIPKSDVEALLKCLKRKLEESENAESPKKTKDKDNIDASEEANSTFPVTSNCIDNDDLINAFSPQIYLPDEENWSNSLILSRDMGSVSSVDSAISYSQQSRASSIDSDTSSIFFTPSFDEIFSGEAELDIEGEILQDSILNSTNHHSDVSNNFNIDHGMGKRGQENIDLNFLENVKGSFFEADNIFAVIPDRIPDTISSNSSNNIFNQMMTKEKSVKLNGSVYGDYVSFPSGQQAADMDLFDHLWGDLENL